MNVRFKNCVKKAYFVHRDQPIGIVTVTYNSRAVIDDFMNSLLKQTHEKYLLYIVDNTSNDDTLQQLANYSDSRIVIIANQVNVGVAEGNNIGIRAALEAGCDSVLLINNDTIFDANLLEKLARGLSEHDCEMISPKILFFDEPERIWCAGGYFSFLRVTGRHFGLGQNDHGQFDQARAVAYSPTCCMLIKARVFDQLGYMDSRYFAYFDDADFCWRACKAGLKLFYLPDARLVHKVHSLTGRESDFTLRYGTRNHVFFVLKHFPLWKALVFVSVYHLFIFAKHALLSRSFHRYWICEKAFWEGVSLFRSQWGGPEAVLSGVRD